VHIKNVLKYDRNIIDFRMQLYNLLVVVDVAYIDIKSAFDSLGGQVGALAPTIFY